MKRAKSRVCQLINTLISVCLMFKRQSMMRQLSLPNMVRKLTKTHLKKASNFYFCFAGNDFPTGFDTQIRKIFRLLFHVLAHIYHCHFKEIVLLQLHAHLNAVFVHFVEFSLKFQIVEEKELEVRFRFSILSNQFSIMTTFWLFETI